jgi:hypothetical protein
MGVQSVTTQPLTMDHLPALRTAAPDSEASRGVEQALVNSRSGDRETGSRTQALVVAFPFSSFGQTNTFITAVRGLPGVVAATPRRMHGGALYLGVDYAGNARLDAGLAGLSEFRPRVTQDGDGMISVVIEAV